MAQAPKHIGVFTSGGDAPGMNAAVRAVVRTSIFRGIKISAIHHGYQGMIEGEIEPLSLSSVANILQRGGTVIKTGRSKKFHEKEGRAKAAEHLKKNGIEGLVAIGGDGTFRGAHLISKEHGIKVVGVPGTIDNDVYGTDKTIGFDTAVNTAVDAIDKIRDTAASHDRLFIVEVMGRNSGYIALEVGLAGGAEFVFTPEQETTVEEAVAAIQRGLKRGKTSSILVASEGSEAGIAGRSYKIAEEIKRVAGMDAKVCVLGHIQRGGAPTASDRNLASRLGSAAIDALLSGKADVMAGLINDAIVYTSLEDTYTKKKTLRKDLFELQAILAT